MGHRDQRAGGGGFKLNFHFSLFVRREVGVAPGEIELPGRFPDANATDLDDVLRSLRLE